MISKITNAESNKTREITARRRSMMGFPSEAVPDPVKTWEESLGNAGPGPRTLYIHIPFCKSRCLFCPFYMGSASELERSAYVDLLLRELETEFSRPELNAYPINAVYFGGGTPTDLSADDMTRILKFLHKSCNLANDCEITMEGRIAGFSDDAVKACIDNGVNRFSIGVQTFDMKIRQSLGRIAEKKEVIKFLGKLVDFNQASVVIDLLYGLPGQTMESWIEDQRVIFQDVPISGLDHYKLNVHPRLPLFGALERGKLPPCPDEEQTYAMYREGEEIMRDCGAVRLSIKHYALDYRERNANNDVSGRKNVCLPFGVHAGGRIGRFSLRQTDDLNFYRERVLAGIKPLSYAGKLPSDHPVNSLLKGQISRQRGINLPQAVAADPKMAELIEESCKPLLDKWLDRELVYPARMDWLRLSSRFMFLHKKLAPELMEKVAEAYKNKKTA